MPRFSITRARKCLSAFKKAPLFQKIGEPFSDKSVVRAKSVGEAKKAMQSQDRAGNVIQNQHTARMIDAYGRAWFQSERSDLFHQLEQAVETSGIEEIMVEAWEATEIDKLDPTGEVLSDITWIAWGHALGLDTDASYYLKYAEPWLMSGHLPCGWKGKVKGAPKAKPGTLPHSGLSIDEALGDGNLVVF